MERQCKVCLDLKDIRDFEIIRSGSNYRRWTCTTCRGAKKLSVRTDERKQQLKQQTSVNDRTWRKSNPIEATLLDCKESDRKKGRKGNDLDLLFIRELVAHGCSYCEETTLRMTLDRIDNSLAHTKK